MHRSLYGAALCCYLIGVACNSQKTDQSTSKVRSFPLLRTVRIPLDSVSTDGWMASQRHPGVLIYIPAAEDELAEARGPQGFAVLHDGRFVIADPLQKRLVLYDSLGAYLDTWPVGVAAIKLTSLANGDLEILDGQYDCFYRLDPGGPINPLNPAQRYRESLAPKYESRLEHGGNWGSIYTTAGARPDSFVVQFENSTRTISLVNLYTNPTDYSYVAIESSQGDMREVGQVTATIRKYTAAGVLIGQINDIMLDYEITPTVEFCVCAGYVYQFRPQKTEIQINIWNTN